MLKVNVIVKFAWVQMLLLPFLVVSCGSTEELAYVSDAVRDSAQVVVNGYLSSIRPGDKLYIHVDSQTPESVVPFNEETNKVVQSRRSTQRSDYGKENNFVDGYLVDQQGRIQFPVIGTLEVADITRDSLSRVIAQRLIDGGYVLDPVVTVELMNFRVAVLGEVQVPRELHITGDRLTIFEALAMCGDLTIYGQRDNIRIVRQINTNASGGGNHSDGSSSFTFGQVDLTSKEVFNSPFYYLQQGDIVYVEPNDKKKKESYRNPETPTYISTAVSSVSLIMHIHRLITSPKLR